MPASWWRVSYTLTVTTVDEFGGVTTQPVTITISDVVLPVTLVHFTAETAALDGVLSWTTATEKNAAYFAVERSINGRDFREIGRREAAGNSTQSLDYDFTDAGVGAAHSLVYYRLRQVDTDGTVAYSGIEEVRFGTRLTWTVEAWPNPFVRKLSVTVTTSAAAPVSVTVLDAAGRVVREHMQAVEAGQTALHLEAAGELPSGTYVLRVAQGTNRSTLRLVKE